MTCQLVITTVSARFLSTPLLVKVGLWLMNRVTNRYGYKEFSYFSLSPRSAFKQLLAGGELCIAIRTIISMLMQPPQVTPSPADKPKLVKDEG